LTGFGLRTEILPQINPETVRLLREIYGINMLENQYSKLLPDIPPVDIVITMGCNVVCPILPSKYREDWGLDDPTGENEEKFRAIIKQIENKIRELAEKIQAGTIWSNKD